MTSTSTSTSTSTTSSASSVAVIGRYVLNPSNPSSSLQPLERSIPLGPLDHFVSTAVPVQVVFVYRPLPSSAAASGHASGKDALLPLERLKGALERTLDYYPHLSGRLSIDPPTAQRSIDRLGSGAVLLSAVCSQPLSQFSSPALPGGISLQRLPGAGNVLLAPFNPAQEAVCADPLLAVQHTRFACGGVSLGVRLHHIITDADGFFQLVRDVAEIYRGMLGLEREGKAQFGKWEVMPELKELPNWRAFMSELMGRKMTEEERKEALDFNPPMFYVKPPADEQTVSVPETEATLSNIGSSPPPTPVTGRFIRYTAAELAALKTRATPPDHHSTGEWVSTFDALSAHIYQCVHRARLQLRNIDPTIGELSATDFLTSVNLRLRLGALLPPRYFPQALFAPFVEIPPQVLADGPLSEIAKYVHKMMRSPSTSSPELMTRTMRWIAAQPDLSQLRSGFRYGSGSFMISQWSRTDMYVGATFDSRPALVAPPFTEISLADGLAYPLPTEAQGTEEDEGAVDVAIALSDPLWAILADQGLLGGVIID